MKNPKSSGKGKGKGSSSSAAAGGADRKNQLESSEQRPSDRPTLTPTAGLKPSNSPASIPLQHLPFHDRPFHLPSVPAHPLHPLARSPFPHPDPAAAPPTPPPYGFHNLDRRTIVLADGSVRSYFALPHDYRMEPAGERLFPYGPGGRPDPEPGFDRPYPPPGRRFSPEDRHEWPPFGRSPGPGPDYPSSLRLDGSQAPESGASSLKRKYGEDDEFAWHRKHVLQYGNPNGIPSGSGGVQHDYLGRSGSPLRQEHHDDLRLLKQPKFGGEDLDDLPSLTGGHDDNAAPAAVDVDQQALKRAFLKFTKLINENGSRRRNYLEDGKSGPLKCIACNRTSKDFTDVHGLVMHTYYAQNTGLHADHLGLHKALCVLMGWDYAKAPEESKAYQSLSADDATANMEDLFLWPPTVIVHNTISGRKKDGRIEGMSNNEMDTKLKELGFSGGKSKSLSGKDSNLGVTLVKFANTQAGLKEAVRLTEFFVKDNLGREGWERAQASETGDDDGNPSLVKVDAKTGEKKRIFYGYLAIASDLEKVDPETRKKAVIKSKKEF